MLGYVGDRVWATLESAIIYTKNNRLCLQDEGNVPVFLAAGDWISTVTVSDDGSLIAFVKSLPNPKIEEKYRYYVDDFGNLGDPFDELWIVNANGSDPRLAFDMNRVPALSENVIYPQIFYLRWLPGTHQLALATGDYNDSYIGNEDLYRIDANSGTYAILLNPGDGGDFYHLSPNGKQLAFIRISGRGSDSPNLEYVSVINVDGSDLRQDIFTYKTVFTYSEYWILATPVWRQDSGGFWIAVPPQDALHSEDAMTTWFVPSDGSGSIPLGIIQPVNTMEAVFSPDGKWVAYVNEEPDGAYALHLVRPGGGDDVNYYSSQKRLFFRYWVSPTQFYFYEENTALKGDIDGEIASWDDTEAEVPADSCEPPQ